MTTQNYIIRPLAATPEVFIYLVLDTAKSNLALARLKVKEYDAQLEL